MVTDRKRLNITIPGYLYQNGVLWVLAWCITFTLAMFFSKTLKGELPLSVIIWVRLLVGLMILSPWYFLQKREDRSFVNCKKDYGIRISSVYLALMCTYFAYRNLPFGLATSIGFTGPLMVALLSPFMVKDRLETKQWYALLVGYSGVLIVLLPDTGASLYHIAVALAANFLAAIALLSVKRLSNKKQSPINILFYSNLGVLILLSWSSYSQWVWPSIKQWGTLCIVGFLATLCQWCYVEALRRGRPAILASLEYSRLFIAIPIGLFWFHEPWFWSILAGGVVILVSNVYMAKTSSKVRFEIPTQQPLKKSA